MTESIDDEMPPLEGSDDEFMPPPPDPVDMEDEVRIGIAILALIWEITAFFKFQLFNEKSQYP